MSEMTRILKAIGRGDPHAAAQLLPLVYDELRQLAAQKLAHEKPGQTLEPTALVHEAYLRLVEGADASPWDHRGHFFAAASEAMRTTVTFEVSWRDAARRVVQVQIDPFLPPDPHCCTSKVVTETVDDVIRNGLVGARARVISGHRQVSYDRAAKVRVGECWVETPQGQLRATYRVRLTNPAAETFRIDVDPVVTPFFPPNR
jgi:hypothetical protein